MPAKTHGDRLDRLEQIVAELATETRRGFDQVAEQFRETDRLIRRANERIDRLAAEDRERAKVFDERVNNLVVAIGEFIRAQRPTS